MKSFKELREEFKSGTLFSVGDIVETKEGLIAEVVNLGTNYVTLVENGNIFKKWITAVNPVTEMKTLDVQSSENLSFKGYTTKNLSKELQEQFSSLIESSQDHYAILNCIQSIDLLLGATKRLVENNFDIYKMSYERSVKYINKFNMSADMLNEAHDILFEVAINEGLKFSSADRAKVATIIAMSAGIDASGDPVSIVNKAALAFKNGRHTPEAWKIVGKMMNKATESGIKWNKDIFAPSTQKFMELN